MDQKTERFRQIENIFQQTLDAELEDREPKLAELCAGDELLRAEVRSLLTAWEESAPETLRIIKSTPVAGAAAERRIGPYALERLLGRGGMGSVYLARRADGQFEQKLAIKLIDLPLAGGVFRERFRQERQLLAHLQHPYIARLLDGGVTEEGELYLAMEHVEGLPITRFCEERKLGQAERIALFRRVCEAVQFAHQNFVVHRDLKPDNILVAADGSPRLLDFGAAKLLSLSDREEDGAARELTREGYLSFTPQYASPEQIKGEPITTATDTYALGVLLYRLLTNSPPYEIASTAIGELLRVVCQEPPRSPSAVLGSRFNSDLEAILLKALRKEPAERYVTVEQMNADLLAFEQNRPVAARKGALRYRAGKFVRRNRYALAAAAVLALSVIAGVGGVLWQARQTRIEARKAETRSKDLRQLSKSLLSELDQAIKELPGSTGAQKLLVSRVLEHLDSMARDSTPDRQTRLDLADAYAQLGEIQGDPYVQNLGDTEGALASFAKALSLVEPMVQGDSRDLEALRAYADLQQYKSSVLFGVDRTAEALPPMRASAEAWDRLVAAGKLSLNALCDAGSAYGTLGDELGQSGTSNIADYPGALVAYRKALKIDEIVLQRDSTFTRARKGVSIYRMKIGSVEEETNPAEASLEFAAAIKNLSLIPDKERQSVSMLRLHAMLLRKLAISEGQLGEFKTSAAHFAEGLPILRDISAQDPKDQRALFDVVIMLDDFSLELESEADPELGAIGPERLTRLSEAHSRLTEAARVLAQILKLDSRQELRRSLFDHTQIRLAEQQKTLHLSGAAPGTLQAALADLKKLAGSPNASDLLLEYAAEAHLRAEPASLRDPAFAVICAERAVTLTHSQMPAALLTLARAYRAAGQLDKSRAAARQGLALLPALRNGQAMPRIRRQFQLLANP